jgi:predicted regulator of Ras-like GTPase activity (Roadblock/LC7/MglB family)
MAQDGSGDYFVTDIDDDFDDDDLLAPPVVVPGRTEQDEPAPSPPTAAAAAADAAVPAVETAPPAPQEQVRPAPSPPAPSEAPSGSGTATADRPQAQTAPESREQRLARALNELMASNLDVQAAALVSMDGFTMASALPDGMQEDRVGAMSAAILGLGERAAAELGRGGLEQVYIEGDDGIVVLVSAGGRAVLTALAGAQARLGLVIFDMRAAAAEIGRILG